MYVLHIFYSDKWLKKILKKSYFVYVYKQHCGIMIPIRQT